MKPKKRIKIPVRVENTEHTVIVSKHDYVANRYDIYFIEPSNWAVAPF